jgi:uncharacterized protein YndB with AHSA1/START domain
MKDVIIKKQTLKHPIELVWKAITEQEEISTWFISADFKAAEGYKYTFTAPKEQDCTQIKGEVKSANPYELVYTWIVQGTETETTVRWNLVETKEGTELTLEHSGISNYPDENTALSMFNSFNGGWDNCIIMLETHLKKSVNV